MDDVLEKLADEAASLDHETFAAKFAGCYLLGGLPVDDEDEEIAFTTGVVALPTWREVGDGSFVPIMEDASAPIEKRFLVKVRKSDRNDFRRRVSVGRARNNDIVLRHESVSKLHAHLHLNTMMGAPSGAAFQVSVSDVGSVNGTFVNGAAVREWETLPISDGDRVQFGTIVCRVYDSFHLYEALKKER